MAEIWQHIYILEMAIAVALLFCIKAQRMENNIIKHRLKELEKSYLNIMETLPEER